MAARVCCRKPDDLSACSTYEIKYIYIYTFQLGQTQIHDSNLSMPCKKVMAFASLVINVTLIP
jgi:hypothetical protein